MRSLKAALMCGAMSIFSTGMVLAQDFDVTGDFDRVISFGDSYSDTGNRIALEPGLPPFFLPGRFSDGPVFTELLAGGQDSMLLPVTDPAFQTNPSIFAGDLTTGDVATIFGATDPRLITFTNDLNADRGTAFTPQDLIDGAIDEPAVTEALADLLEPEDVYNLDRTMDLSSGVFATSSLNFAVAGGETLRNQDFVPSIRQQVEFYFANGGTFNDGDLITFLSGANDNSQLGFVDAATLGTQVADENIAVLELIAQNGSGTIAVVGLADLSLIPGGRNQPDFIQDIARTFSFTAIDRQFSELQRLADENPDVNFVYVDLLALQNAVEVDPLGFGFTNITDTCITGAPGSETLCSNPDEFFFIDFIHPTQPGHELLASLVVAHVLAGTSAANTYVMDEMALASRRTAVNAVFDRLNRLARQDDNFALFIEGFGSGYNRQRDGSPFGYTADFAGLRVGAEGRFDNGILAGVSLGFSEGDVNQQIVDFDFSSVQFDIYGRYNFGRSFVDLTFGFEDADYDNFQRILNVGPLINTGSTGGQTYSLAGRFGQTFELPNAKITPAFKLAYYDTQVDGFAEAGALARIAYASRSSQYLIGGVEMAADFQATRSVRMFTSVGYDFLIDGQQPDIFGQLINNTAQPFSNRAGDPDVDGFDVSVGLTATIGAGFIGTAQFEWLGQFDGSNAGRITFGITKPL
ncbi:MAG: autotransporter domain-containing protein [Pseudomonadota bacterium]